MDGLAPRHVDVAGRRTRVLCHGRGRPTVVLEAGMGQTLETWRLVLPALGEETLVVAYDRAGLGESDAVAGPRTLGDMAADLHEMLRAVPAPPPYLLVGHSLGGLIVRVYAGLHPEEVAGVVLVDSPNPDYIGRALPILGPPQEGECAEIAEARDWFEKVLAGTDEPDPGHDERVLMGVSLRQVPGAGSLGDMPLAVVLAGKPAEFSADFPADKAAAISEMLIGCGRELADLSSRGRWILAEASGHMVQLDQPDVVVEAVRGIVAQIREGELGAQW